jgi:hypothetical protein
MEEEVEFVRCGGSWGDRLWELVCRNYVFFYMFSITC